MKQQEILKWKKKDNENKETLQFTSKNVEH